MTILDEMQKEPWRFDFLLAMRRLERSHIGRPRIGDSATRREDYVDLGQDPYLEFPASNLSRVITKDDRLKIFVKFLGLLGPQGALPLSTTEESLLWFQRNDDAFPDFSTSSIIDFCSCSFAPGPIRGRSPSTTALTPIALSPTSARRSGSDRRLCKIWTAFPIWQSYASPGWSDRRRNAHRGSSISLAVCSG